jgi:hypothetical protein
MDFGRSVVIAGCDSEGCHRVDPGATAVNGDARGESAGSLRWIITKARIPPQDGAASVDGRDRFSAKWQATQ